MNNLQIFSNNLDNPTVSARELHEMLKVEKRFSAWFESNSQSFVENEDYFGAYLEVQSNQYGGTKEVQDYKISLDMAKHICLMSRTDEGKKARQYLIDLEKAWNTPELVMARGLMASQKLLEQKEAENKRLKLENKEMKPKALFADAVSSSKTSILIGELAKLLKQNGINMGQNRLFTWLRDNGYLIKRKGTDWNMPTQRSMEMGLFKIKENTHIDGNGCNITTKTPVVTGKGQIYFINHFLKIA